MKNKAFQCTVNMCILDHCNVNVCILDQCAVNMCILDQYTVNICNECDMLVCNNIRDDVFVCFKPMNVAC